MFVQKTYLKILVCHWDVLHPRIAIIFRLLMAFKEDYVEVKQFSERE